MEFVAIDFETTPCARGEASEPWQLGLALVRDREIVETAEFFFGTAQTPDFEPILAQWERWSPYLIGRRLVAHNLATERTILRRIAPLTKWGPWTDTLQLTKAKYPKLPSYALGDICATFGLTPRLRGRTWHDGLYDAIACAHLALFLG